MSYSTNELANILDLDPAQRDLLPRTNGDSLVVDCESITPEPSLPSGVCAIDRVEEDVATVEMVGVVAMVSCYADDPAVELHIDNTVALLSCRRGHVSVDDNHALRIGSAVRVRLTVRKEKDS